MEPIKRVCACLVLALCLSPPAWAQILTPSPQSVNAASSGVTDCGTGECASWVVPNAAGSVTSQITGTMTSMTLTAECSVDNRSWFTCSVRKMSDGSLTTTTTSTGQFSIPNTGITGFRWRCTTYVSGGANITLTRGTATSANGLVSGPASNPFIIGDAYLYFNSDPAIANITIGNTTPPVFTTGHDNLFLGLNSGDECTSCIGNLGIGHSALGSMVSGINNTAVGWDSQFASVGGNNNTSLGEDALKQVLTGGDNNTAVGYTAGINITTGDENVAIAPNALFTNDTGSQNIAIGYSALNLLDGGGQNIGIGHGALESNVTGSRNTAVGDFAGHDNTGSDSVFLGNLAGRFETASNKLFIDNQGRTNEATARTNAMLYGVFNSSPSSQTLVANAIFSSSQSFQQPDRDVANPPYSFSSDSDTGLRWLSSGIISFVSNATDVASIQSTGFNIATGKFLRSSSTGTKLTFPGVDGEVDILDNAGTTQAGLRQKLIVEVNTTTKTPTALESNELFTNTGDADGSTFTLLNDPPLGIVYHQAVTAAQTVTIAASAGETLKFGASTCGTSLASNTVGSFVTVVAATGGSGAIWITKNAMGVWVCTP